MNSVHFSPNIPVDGLRLAEPIQPEQFCFELLDGRSMSVPASVTASMRMNALKPGERFGLCLRWNGDDCQPRKWDFWLSPETEKARAAAEEPEMERQLRESLAQSAARLRLQIGIPAIPSPVADLGGISGAVRRPVRSSKPAASAIRVSCAVAFRSCLKIVVQSLDEAGEQWSDAAKQDGVSTLFIAMAKAGFVDFMPESPQ